MKALNLLRVVAYKYWGADCVNLLKLYCFHVHSNLYYGCVVYGSAWQSVLESLDRVQNAALRTCYGAFKTSLVAGLYVEAGELPLELRRPQLCLQYICKLRSNTCNMLSGMYLALDSDACFRLDQILSPHMVSG